MAFLSVIIAAHNSGQTLAATLKSLSLAINNQPDIEVVIINDNSTDETQAIIDAWKIKHAPVLTDNVEFANVGKVRNHGVSLASGQYITMLDSDDILKPGSLQDAVLFLQQHQPDMLLTHLLEIRDRAKISAEWQGFSPIELSGDEAIRRFLRHKDFQAHLIGQFIHRDLYLQAPIPPMVCYEDFAVFPTMLRAANKIYYQQSGHYYYIKRSESLSSALDATKITHLVDCTLAMENVFPAKFAPLMNCHWLDIYTNHKARLTPAQMAIVKSRVQQLYSAAFFFSKDVRFSYKKRALKTLLKP